MLSHDFTKAKRLENEPKKMYTRYRKCTVKKMYTSLTKLMQHTSRKNCTLISHVEQWFEALRQMRERPRQKGAREHDLIDR